MTEVTIQGELTIYEVAAMQKRLRDAVAARSAADEPVRLEVSGLGTCDGAGLQLLLALARSGREQGFAVELAGTGGGLRRLLDRQAVSDRFRFVEAGEAA